jgi:hypothetical protein
MTAKLHRKNSGSAAARASAFGKDHQRVKARPELKQAIDRIWRRIVDEGW